MKKYFYLVLPAVVFIIGGCSKTPEVHPVIPVTSEVSVQSVSYPSFINSTWNNVNGGTVALKFNKVNDKDSVLSSINDSTNFTNLSSYIKILDKGTYDITVSSKNQTALADTFIRFNAKIKSYLVENKQAIALTATSNDGLITIGQSFIQDNTIPVFKTDSGGITYKMGLANGFYYLYIRGGVKGNISFISKTSGQSVTKPLSITTLNQLNLEVVTNKGLLTVVFTKFVYNQVAVSSSTLVTININADDYYFNHSTSAYFVATDETGKILNEVKFVKGTTFFKLSALQPFDKDRFNFYIIINPDDVNSKPNIVGYLQVKRGSTYHDFGIALPQENKVPFIPHLKNTTGFDRLLICNDAYAVVGASLADTVNFTPNIYVDNGSPLYVQMLKNNTYTYNMFTIPKGTTNFNVDLSKVTKTPLMKTVTGPASGFGFSLMAKNDRTHFDAYTLSLGSTQTNKMDIYYPSEPFQEYETMAGYSIGDFTYEILTTGTTIPDQVDTYDASFSVSGRTLANFVPAISGDYSYYHAYFENTAGSPLKVQLFSPSAANYMHAKLPDFAKYLSVVSINLANQKINQFQLIQIKNFDEKNFIYFSADDIRSTPDLNVKMVYHGFE